MDDIEETRNDNEGQHKTVGGEKVETETRLVPAEYQVLLWKMMSAMKADEEQRSRNVSNEGQQETADNIKD